MRSSFALATLLAVPLSLAVAPTPNARACGGCFHQPSENESSVVTDHRMAIALGADATTLWDQIRYAGNPADFAWVLPVRGAVVVGLGDPAFLDALDAQTAPQLSPPTLSCVGGPGSGGSMGCTPSCGSSDEQFGSTPTGEDQSFEDGGVTILGQSTVGPYAVVEIHGTDTTSIVDWLTTNGYAIPPNIAVVLGAYVQEGFDFVAVRLAPGQGVQAMQPIRVSWSGQYASLPLRMVAAGVASDVGVDLFVIGDGRWTTKSFPATTIDDDALVWDFSAARSNYTTLRASANAQASGRTFVLESSIVAYGSSFPTSVPYEVDAGIFDASPSGDAGPPPDVTANEQDVDVAFPQTDAPRRITRLHADLPVAALGVDLDLQADADQKQIGQYISVQKYTHGEAQCPSGVSGGGTPASILGLGGSTSTGTSPPFRHLPLVVVSGLALVAAGRRIVRRRR